MHSAAALHDPKQLATAKARAALAGVTLIESTNDREEPVCIASRGAWVREFGSLEEVHAWLDRVSGIIR